MKTLQKRSLFWDVVRIDPRGNAKFIIERILNYGDEDDFRWANDFYGKERIKNVLVQSRALDKKSLSFWRQYFNIEKTE